MRLVQSLRPSSESDSSISWGSQMPHMNRNVTRVRLLGAAILILPALTLTTASVNADEVDYTARDGGATSSEMLARGDGGLPGMSFVRPVLEGVLYRAGFKGGDKDRSGLSGTQRETLCKAGFSGARYIDFGTKTTYGTTHCGTNNFEYGKISSSKTHDLMKDIHTVIENPDKGPILVHCMWGVHSSGAVSAMALVQFCGWSEAEATKYWNEARNNAPCSGGCDEWIAGKFKNFKPDPTLTITAEQQRLICPQK